MPTTNLTGWLQSMFCAMSGVQKISYSLGEGEQHSSNWLLQHNDVEDQHSISGTIFMLAGGLICWSTQKQGSIATSTCEAELNSIKEVYRQSQ